MIFWHLGCGIALARVLYGRSLDYRWTIAGLLLPDLLDKPVGRIMFRRRFQSGRLVGHSLIFASAFALASSRRGAAARGGRKPNAGEAASWTAGVLIHLSLDAIWSDPRVALWPGFGPFPRKPVGGSWWKAFLPGMSSAKFWEELTGAILIAWVWNRSDLATDGGARRFLESGRLFG